MATAAPKAPRSIDEATQQVVALNERFLEVGKRAGHLYLDGCDKLVEGVTTFQQKLAEQSQNDALKSAVASQVDMTRELASTYTSAARELIA